MPPSPVYDDLLTRESARRLAAIVKELPEPVALCGGHAVRLRVLDEWKATFDQEYFGSRDIDVAYKVDLAWSEQQLRASALGQAPATLGRIGYEKSGSYRFEAILDSQGRVLKKAPPSPAMIEVDYFYLYVDTIATAAHPDAKRALGFNPIVEPVLETVFDDPSRRSVLEELGPNVFLPATPILVATKLASLPQRGDASDKALKDLCDLYALTQFGRSSTVEIRKVIHGALPKAATLVNAATRHELLPKAVNHLDIQLAEFRAVVGPLAAPTNRQATNGR